MTDTFKVGEIAIYVRPGSPYHGTEVEILSALYYGHWVDDLTGRTEAGMCYDITDPAGELHKVVAEPHNLKKKKPPQRDIDQIVSWDDCVWKPAGVTA